MDLTALLAFNIALLGALISPGTALLVTLREALGRGRRAGIACALGLAAAAT